MFLFTSSSLSYSVFKLLNLFHTKCSLANSENMMQVSLRARKTNGQGEILPAHKYFNILSNINQ